MIRKLALAGALALASAATANAATFTITFQGQPTAMAGNDFSGLLGGLTSQVGDGASIALDGPGEVQFFYLGSQSAGASNTFNTGVGPGSLHLTESADANNFASPVFIGSQYYGGGAITDWFFSSNVGDPASIGEANFAIYVDAGAASPRRGLASILIGFDDGRVGDGLDYDDIVILAQVDGVAAPIPEPATWALLIAGFGLAGAALRRRREAVGSA